MPLTMEKTCYLVMADLPHRDATSPRPPQTMDSGTDIDEAALARVFRPDTAINLSPPDNTAVHLNDEMRQYIASQLELVSP